MSITDFLLKLGGICCPKCHYQLTGADLQNHASEIKTGKMNCPKCQQVITPEDFQNLYKPAPIDKTALKISPTLAFVHNQNGTLSLEVPWQKTVGILLLLGSLTWFAIVGLIFYSALKGGGITVNGVFVNDQAKILMYVGLFSLGGLPTFLIGLMFAVNRRKIEVGQNQINFSDGPFWISNLQTVPTLNIANLAIHKRSAGEVNGETQYRYHVDIHFKTGQVLNLCKVSKLDDAVYIEQSVEKFLNIKDDISLDRLNAG